MDTPNFNDFFWKDDIGLFDVATDKIEFKRIFKDAIGNPSIPKDIQQKREILFEKWFGSINSNSLEKYYDIIKNVLN